jgi:hypothetical protein
MGESIKIAVIESGALHHQGKGVCHAHREVKCAYDQEEVFKHVQSVYEDLLHTTGPKASFCVLDAKDAVLFTGSIAREKNGAISILGTRMS